ncbi:MAG TPA: hypothetical protein DDY43_13535 [Synechococcales bacterium UBA10510]|nr:hypothetical protein [Synechococcales bacterium UBA10510]
MCSPSWLLAQQNEAAHQDRDQQDVVTALLDAQAASWGKREADVGVRLATPRDELGGGIDHPAWRTLITLAAVEVCGFAYP